MNDGAITSNQAARRGSADSEDRVEDDLLRQALKRGFYYKPFVPLQVTGTFFNPEPSVVDRLAAKADPAGEAARRVREWEEVKAAEDRLQESIEYKP